MMRFDCTLLCIILLSACGASPAAKEVSQVVVASPTIPLPPTATAAPTEIPKLLGSCQNPFIPLAEGNTWQYQTTNERGVFSYSLEALAFSKDRTETMLLRFSDTTSKISIEELVVCQDGAIDNFPNYVMDMLFADRLDKLLDTVHQKDPSMPGYDAFAAAGWKMDWSTTYLTEDNASLIDPVTKEGLVIGRSSELGLKYSLDGTVEEVTVPAGTFEAFVVAHSFEFLVTIPAKYTNSAAAVLTVYTTQWYAPNIGLVKSTVDKATIRSGGLEMDVPLDGMVELTQFHIE